MLVWRLDADEFVATALSGEGARLNGGRWNEVGTPVVYLSTALSGSAMEKFVHFPRSARHQALKALGIEIPDELIRAAARPSPLPRDWRAPSGSPAAQAWGSGWCASASSLVAIVPGVLLPLESFELRAEHNLLLNPRHPDIARVKRLYELPYSFDARAWK